MTVEASTGESPVRIEHDLIGRLEVPADARYGIHTMRALANFAGPGALVRDFPGLCRALGAVKLASLRANVELGLIPDSLTGPLRDACEELADGREGLCRSLVLPLLQGGAGTSTNMSVNEILANRTLELMGRPRGDYATCHPNDHVNCSQSTNDVYPTALRVALLYGHGPLIEALYGLHAALKRLASRAGDVPKLGRTQLQDAVPLNACREALAWAERVRRAKLELQSAAHELLEVNTGGTAIGTGIGAPPRFAELAVGHLRTISGFELRQAEDLVAATTDCSALLRYSSALRGGALALGKICNDLRLLASGPRTGLAEYTLPGVQAGSSIMPGKVNPVVCEHVNVVAFRIRGLDDTTALALDAGQLQLNAMLPAAALSLLESQELLGPAAQTLAVRCIDGAMPVPQRMREAARSGLGEATELASAVGYEAASEIVIGGRR